MVDVEILLATYKPNRDFFRKLLQSIKAQTYLNIHVSVLDDSADDAAFTLVSEMVKAELRTVPFTIDRNSRNLGSTKTFERLTQLAKGTYLAYCDQDDIWEADKIEKLTAKIEAEQAMLCYSDLSIIDQDDHLTAQSFQNINKRIRHVEGDGLFCHFLHRNSVTGCTMLIRGDVARQALPFLGEYYIHDHWLALTAASMGRIAYVSEPLVRYRLHGGNQIGNTKLFGISDKQSYLTQKLNKEAAKYEYLLSAESFKPEYMAEIRKTLSWVQVRKRFFEKRSLANTGRMIAALPKDPQLILFEFFLAIAPAAIGRRLIQALR